MAYFILKSAERVLHTIHSDGLIKSWNVLFNEGEVPLSQHALLTAELFKHRLILISINSRPPLIYVAVPKYLSNIGIFKLCTAGKQETKFPRWDAFNLTKLQVE